MYCTFQDDRQLTTIYRCKGKRSWVFLLIRRENRLIKSTDDRPGSSISALWHYLSSMRRMTAPIPSPSYVTMSFTPCFQTPPVAYTSHIREKPHGSAFQDLHMYCSNLSSDTNNISQIYRPQQKNTNAARASPAQGRANLSPQLHSYVSN